MLDGETTLDLPARPPETVGRPVVGWCQPVTVPTHRPEPPSRFPAYLDRRVYQGSSGRVYPLPFHDRISAEAVPGRWEAVHLENRFLRVLVLPELGGRVHLVRDLTRDRDLFHVTDVIKPALVGLAGPWIAGGVEFNWPQHHRPATFLPVDVDLEHEPDGSVTVWCSDHDPFDRMKGMHGIRLRPDRAALEVRVRLYNRSETVRTFLWWANAAARAGDNFQSFFPDDVTVVADHARRAVTAFPAADRRYYGVDYPARRDRQATAADGTPVRGDRIDWYRNIPVPTSYMALRSDGSFFGGYDHDTRGGFVHVADPAVAVGKKQWTWGDAPFGHAWDRHLSDDGSHYVELMAGAFTDNQPDFSFLAPGETKVFEHTWYPLHDIGPVRAATPEAALAVTVETAGAPAFQVGVVVTVPRPGLRVEVLGPDRRPVAAVTGDALPGAPYRGVLAGIRGDAVEVLVRHGGAELVRWRATPPALGPVMTPATQPPPPAAVATVEELALIGAHLEQYRHATRSPEPYWREALRRDAGHVASCVALAVRSYRRREFDVAEALLRRAVDRLTAHNGNPADTGAVYLLGLVLEAQGRDDEAYRRHAAASWARAWRAPAGYRMARLDAAHGRDDVALHRLEDVLRVEPDHLQALAVTVVVLRRRGLGGRADAVLRSARALDPLDAWLRDLAGLPPSRDAQTCVDVALEYVGVGELESALRVLDLAVECEASRPPGQTAVAPLLGYHRADLLRRLGRHEEARAVADQARRADPSWCFPWRSDDAGVLERAVTEDSSDAPAHALLGHWLYAWDRHTDAVDAWRTSAALDPGDPVVWRNLGLAAANHGGDLTEARAAYDRALALAPGDARLLYESDRLDERRGVSPQRRLERLLQHREAVGSRDDTTVQLVHLLLTAGRLDEARALLASRRFQPWEGGEGEVLRAWERASLLLAQRYLDDGDPGAALSAADEGLHPPSSLGEARHPLASVAPLALARGDALSALGRSLQAEQAWEGAAGSGGDFLAMSPQDHSEATASRIVALRRLGRLDAAARLHEELREFCERLEAEPGEVDYFATSLPAVLLFDEDPQQVRARRVTYLQAQVDVLAGDVESARRRLAGLLATDPAHSGAADMLASLDREPVPSPGGPT